MNVSVASGRTGVASATLGPGSAATHLGLTQRVAPQTNFLKSKFQVGSGKSDKINYAQCEKV